LLLNVDLDQLPGHLVAQGTGDGFQFGELGAPGKALGIKFSRQFPSHRAQTRVKLLPDLRRVLAHVRSPLQVAGQIDREPWTSIGRITSVSLVVQTMSCALCPAIQ